MDPAVLFVCLTVLVAQSNGAINTGTTVPTYYEIVAPTVATENYRKTTTTNAGATPTPSTTSAAAASTASITTSASSNSPVDLTTSRRTCVLPEYQHHVNYTTPACMKSFMTQCPPQPGITVPEDYPLYFKCRRGYQMDDGKGSALVFCIGGNWYPGVPKCQVLVAQSNGASNTGTTVPTYYETVAPTLATENYWKTTTTTAGATPTPSTTSTAAASTASITTTASSNSPVDLTTSRRTCVLPEYQRHVNYTTPTCIKSFSTQCPPQPGTTVPEDYPLYFKCRRGYQMDDGKGSAVVFCIDGNWYPAVPKCRVLVAQNTGTTVPTYYETVAPTLATENYRKTTTTTAGATPTPSTASTAAASTASITTTASSNSPVDLTTSRRTCVLPEYQRHVNYTTPTCMKSFMTQCPPQPGTTVPEDYPLYFKCRRGYQMDDGKGSALVFCIDGNWYPAVPKCRVLVTQNTGTTVPTYYETVAPTVATENYRKTTTTTAGATPTPSTASTAAASTASITTTASSNSPVDLTTSRRTCVLPEYQHHVNYTTPTCIKSFSTQCPPQPGTTVPEDYPLYFKCRRGYQMDDGKGSAVVFCIDGNWYPAVPKCRVLGAQNNGAINTGTTVPTYYEIVAPTVATENYRKTTTTTAGATPTPSTTSTAAVSTASITATASSNSPVDLTTSRRTCLLPEYKHHVDYTAPACLKSFGTQCPPQPGTNVPENYPLHFKCRRGYQMDDGKDSAVVFCIDGNWYPAVPKCREVCGKMSASSALTEDPWHVAIYNEGETLRHFCLGTLISPHTVLTAAYCVIDESSLKTTHPFQIKVVISNRNLNLTDELDVSYTVNFTVREIAVAPRYFGVHTLNAHNLALLDLKESLNVMPACIDWHRQVALTPGDIGTLTFWSRKGYETQITISRMKLTYVDKRECVFDLLGNNSHLAVPDKICGANKQATDYPQVELSGSGLMFENSGIHYVMAIASNANVYDKNGTWVLFTNVTDCDLLTWLQDTKRQFDEYHNKLN